MCLLWLVFKTMVWKYADEKFNSSSSQALLGAWEMPGESRGLLGRMPEGHRVPRIADTGLWSEIESLIMAAPTGDWRSFRGWWSESLSVHMEESGALSTQIGNAEIQASEQSVRASHEALHIGTPCLLPSPPHTYTHEVWRWDQRCFSVFREGVELPFPSHPWFVSGSLDHEWPPQLPYSQCPDLWVVARQPTTRWNFYMCENSQVFLKIIPMFSRPVGQ